MKISWMPVMVVSTAISLHAWEPVKVDVTQQDFAPESYTPDHLEPSDPPVPQDYYLVAYSDDEAMAYQNDFFTIKRRDSDGKYILRKWSDWAKTDSKPPPEMKLGPTVEMEIPEDIAVSTYEMWVNALYEVRYDRAGNNTFDGWRDIYSTFVRGKGWLAGSAESPGEELPPKWMSSAARSLLQLAIDRDVARCRLSLTIDHDKLFAYWKTHGLSPSVGKAK